MSHIFNHIYVTIKITLKCNLACQYCYGRDNHASGLQMTDEEIIHGIDFVHGYAVEVKAKSLMLCWHGGEPFLLSKKLPKFIEYANKRFSQSGISVTHGIQTNATLLLPSTFDMIKRYFNGFVGVSIDLYSGFRTFPNGKLSTDIAVRNIDLALENGIRCGAINLITQQNLSHIEDIYNFYKVRKMNVRLARVFPINDSEDMTSPMYVSDEQFANAMIEYFDIWANDTTPAKNSDIVGMIGDLLTGIPSLCLREQKCHQRYTALSPGGDVFSCAEFDVPESVIGNFLKQTPMEFAMSDSRERIAAKAPIPQECNGCDYLPVCHGGCLRERFMVGYSYRCKSNKLYWDHIVDWLKSKGASLYILKGKTREEKQQIIKQIFGKQI